MSTATLERQPFLGTTNYKPSARKFTPWKHSTKDTLASIQHVMLSELTYRDRGGDLEFSFWSLAPIQPGRRRGDQVKTHEFVWLIRDGAVWHALADRETGEIVWREYRCG
jgi:hypothetical protein